MAEKCITTIDDTSINFINNIEYNNKINTTKTTGTTNIISNHLIKYDDNTPLISLNNSTSDLNNILTSSTTITIVKPELKTTTTIITPKKIELITSVNDDDEDENIDGNLLIVGNCCIVDNIDDDDNHDIPDNNVGNINNKQQIKSSDKVNIYLETPAVDEHNILTTESTTITRITATTTTTPTQTTKTITVKPKRLSDEFFSADDFDDDDDNDDSNNDKIKILEHKREGVLVLKTDKSRLIKTNNKIITTTTATTTTDNDMIEGCTTSKNIKKNNTILLVESSAFINNDNDTKQLICCNPIINDNHLNIVCDNNINNINNNNNDNNNIIIEEEIIYDENDVQSMDAIERRDYEQEQILTGGVIVRNCSLINNNNNSENRLNIGVINKNINDDNTVRSDDVDKKSLEQQNTLTTTPTSSRCSTIRTITTTSASTTGMTTTPTTKTEIETGIKKSSIKLNLSTSLDRNDESEFNKLDKNKIKNSKNFNGESSRCKQLQQQEPEEFVVEDFINTNSNDSLSSINYQEIVKNECNNDIASTSSSSSSTTIKYIIQNDECDITEQIPSCSTTTTSSSSKEGSKIFVTASSSSIASTSTSSSPNCQFAEFPTSNCCEEEIPEVDNVNEQNEIIENDEEEEISGSNRTKPIIRPSRFQNVDVLLEQSRGKGINFDGNEYASSSSSSRRLPRTRNIDDQVLEPSQMAMIVENDNEFDEDTWADCEEGSDIEEICTCKNYTDEDERNGSSEDELPSRDVDLSGFTNIDTLPDDILHDPNNITPRIHRKRKLTINLGSDTTPGGRKRLALQLGISPRSASIPCVTSLLGSSPLHTSLERRTPRSLIPTKDNPPPELCDWLIQFQKWSHAERILAVDRLIERCEPTQVRHMMKVIEPQFQRDFISLLPKEVALQVLTYLEPNDLLRAAQTCRSWRFLCDDNLLWKEKCKQVGIVMEPLTDKPKRGRAGNMPRISSPWKAAYMRQNIIEMNWRSRPIREPKILKGHDDHVITCLQFCGNRIVSGSDDNTLKVWSAVSGKCLRTLVGHTGGVWSSQMSGNIIISGSTDRTLKVWNAESGQCVHTLFGHTSTVRCMHLHENKVVSGSRDATLRVWDINSGVCLHVLVGHLAAVRCVQYDGRLVVSGAYDYMVKVWNPERQECLHTLQGHTNRVYSLQFDGVHVVSGSLDTSIRVWDAETGSCKHTLMGHQSLTSGMELRQNILVSGNADSTVKVWDIITGQCLQTLSGSNKHQSAVTCLQFNSRFVITSSDDGTVKLWDVKTGEFIRNLVALDSGGSGGVVWRIRANDTKLVCAVGSRNGTEETKLMVLDFDVEGACLKCS